jgi:hypothetical protein
MKIVNITASARKSWKYQTYEFSATAQVDEDLENAAESAKTLQAFCRKRAIEQLKIDFPMDFKEE